MGTSLQQPDARTASSPRLAQWWSSLVAIVDQRHNALPALRRRLLLLTSLLIVTCLALLVLSELQWGQSDHWMIVSGMLVLLMAATFDYVRSGRYEIYCQLLVGALTLLVLALIIASGGQSRAPQICLPSIAVLAAMLLPTRATLTWAAIMLLGLVLSFYLRSTSAPVYLPLNPLWLSSAVERMAAVLVVMSVSIGVWYNGLIERLDDRLSSEITGLAEVKVRCEKAEQRLEHYVDLASAWLWETDDQHRLVYLSAGFERSTGVNPKHALGQTPVQVMRVRYPTNTTAEGFMLPMLERRGFKDQLLSWHEPLTGTLNHYANSASPMFDQHGVFRGFRGRVVNVSERDQAMRQVRESVQGDFLTGLMNRGGMLEALDRALMRVRESELVGWWIQIDLDQFHEVNTRLNFAQGDAYLRRFARALSEIVTQPDTLARMDGDEFGALLLDVSKEQVHDIATRILGMSRGLRMEFLGADALGSASLGVARFSSASPSVGAIVLAANEACVQARSAGGARAVFAG